MWLAVKGEDMSMMIAYPNERECDDHDDDESPTEELIEMLRESLRDVEEGRTRPAREVMVEIREMLSADADAN